MAVKKRIKTDAIAEQASKNLIKEISGGGF